MDKYILMADVIGSRRKKPDKLIQILKSVVKKVNSENKDQIVSPLTITLGDEFQGIVKTLDGGVEIIIKIEELLIHHTANFKLRYTLHYGQIKTPINTKIAYGMLGQGLTKARESLSEAKKGEYRFIFMIDKSLDDLLNNCFFIYQSIIDFWKPKDLKIVSAFLKYDDYKKVSKLIKIDPSSAWRRKKSLKINEYNSIKKIIHTVIKKYK